MIKNAKQAAITRAELDTAKREKEAYLASDHQAISAATHQYHLDSFDGLIDDLQHQLDEYDNLKNGNFHCLNCNGLEDLPKLLVGARLAQKMSQKVLGEKLQLSEQQIQRYESTDYESISFSRILDVADCLKLRLDFKPLLIIGSGPVFMLPEGVKPDDISEAETATRLYGSLIL